MVCECVLRVGTVVHQVIYYIIQYSMQFHSNIYKSTVRDERAVYIAGEQNDAESVYSTKLAQEWDAIICSGTL